MSTYRMTIEVEVSDELLRAHDGNAQPPPNDVAEWWGGDLERAIEEGIASLVHSEIEAIEELGA